MKNKANGLTAGRLTMMALGTVIGGSFFLGSSVAIKAAGPAIILSYLICAVMVYFILFALSEMTVSNPDSASFRTFASQYINNGTGFVVGWVYWTGMVISMSSEATAVSILFRTWFPSVSIPILVLPDRRGNVIKPFGGKTAKPSGKHFVSYKDYSYYRIYSFGFFDRFGYLTRLPSLRNQHIAIGAISPRRPKKPGRKHADRFIHLCRF